MNRWSLENKCILITGASRGIGFGVAQAAMKLKPTTIIICSSTQEHLDRALSELETYNENNEVQVSVMGTVCDISTETGRSTLVEFCKDRVDRLDVLVNNVGVNIRKSITEQEPDEYFKIMRTNVDSAYFLCRNLLPLLKNAQNAEASVVNVASAAGVQSSGTGAAYGMSKAAVIQFSKILACEWAQFGIRVNAVAPWMCMTPMLVEAIKGDVGHLDKVNDWTPMGRIANIEEIVDPIVFLMMPCSSYVTGQCLGIDGGLTAQGFQGPCVNTMTTDNK
jgi:Tropinone reductase 1